MDSQGITKKQSSMVQGFAILLMLYHHFFLAPEAYGDTLSFFHIGRVSKLAWFGKICVGMFAFISGYGMCRVLQKKKEMMSKTSFFSILGSEYCLVLKQIISLLIRVWLIFIVAMFFVFQSGAKIFEPKEYFSNFFFLQTNYNGAFWYVEQYMKMMLLLPLVDMFFTSFSNRQSRISFLQKWIFYGVLAIVVLGLCIIGKFFSPELKSGILILVSAIRPAFTLVFIIGYLIARFRIYERISQFFDFLSPWMHYITGAFLMLAVLYIRTRLAFAPAYAQTDFILVPFWVYGFLSVIHKIKPLEAFFLWFGKLSTYMWLTHVFIYDFTSLWLRNHLQSHLLFYVIQVIMAMLVAMLLRGIELGIHQIKISRKS